MRVGIAYGKGGLEVRLPDGIPVDVVAPAHLPPAPDQRLAILESLRRPVGRPPLREMVRPSDTVAIVFSDITRPTPNWLLIPAILEELEAAGVARGRIVLFNSTGTHRLNTRAELAGMLGESVVEGYRILQNDARAAGAHRSVGATSSGNEIWLLSQFLDCSFKIITGFIEPHFFAGFSGGGKGVMPGLARLDTVMRNHTARNIDDERSSWGVLDGNPIQREVREAVALVDPEFLVNVTLDRNRAVTACFSGHWVEAHLAGCEFVRSSAMVAVERPYDIVITSNSGYPLDLNLYQAVKGMSAAAQIVKPGGAIIIAAECWDGLPDHGSFGRLLAESRDAGELIARIRAPGFAADDQWQAQILASIVLRNEVYVHSDGLTAEQLAQAKLHPCPSIEERVELLRARSGGSPTICVLPDGPQTIPYLMGRIHGRTA